MGNQKAFARTKVARDLTSNVQHPTPSDPASALMFEVCSFEVPGRGLEPLRISPPDPKSGASANFATLASLISRNLCVNMYN